MVEVVNMRTCKPPWGQEGDVRIDRVTKWGNPFHIGVLNRDEVCDEYERWFFDKSGLDIYELAGAKRLGCWCKPKRCHGDFLKRLLDNMLRKTQSNLFDYRRY